MKGGTNAIDAPTIDYFLNVFQPIAKRFGIECQCDLEKRGFYPKGKGIVKINVKPVKQLLPISIVDPGHIVSIRCNTFYTSRIPGKVPKQISEAAVKELKKNFFIDEVSYQIDLLDVSSRSFGDGVWIQIIAESNTGCIFGATGIGDRDTKAEVTGKTAANELIEDILAGGCFDRYLQDQLIIFMGLASGTSSIKTGPLTLHTKTSIHFVSLMTGAKFEVNPIEEDQTFIISCQGIGYENRYLK